MSVDRQHSDFGTSVERRSRLFGGDQRGLPAALRSRRSRSIRAGPMSEGTVVSELAMVQSVLDGLGLTAGGSIRFLPDG